MFAYSDVVTSGRELQAAREAAGLSRPAMGEQVGVGDRQILNWERLDEVPPSVMRRVSPILWPTSATVDLASMDDLALGAHMQAVVAELMSRLALKHTPKGENPHDRPHAGGNAPTTETKSESSLTVHPKRPTRQAGKRPPRPTPPGPTSK